MRVRLAAVGLVALAASGPAACGGSDYGTEADGGAEAHESRAAEAGAGECERLASESAREDCERAEAAARVPAADRAAYYQLATSVGLLRSASVAARRGDPRPRMAGRAELAAARIRLAKSSPRDADLRAARRRLLSLLAGAGREPTRSEARRELAALRGVEHRLSSYLHREPANASLLPD